MWKFWLFLFFPRAVRDRKKTRNTGRKPASYSFLYEREKNKRMRGVHTAAADFVSVPWTCSGAKSKVIMDCQPLFLGLLDNLSAADGDRTAGGASRPRADGVGRPPCAALLPSVDDWRVPPATVDLVAPRPLPEARPSLPPLPLPSAGPPPTPPPPFPLPSAGPPGTPPPPLPPAMAGPPPSPPPPPPSPTIDVLPRLPPVRDDGTTSVATPKICSSAPLAPATMAPSPPPVLAASPPADDEAPPPIIAKAPPSAVVKAPSPSTAKAPPSATAKAPPSATTMAPPPSAAKAPAPTTTTAPPPSTAGVPPVATTPRYHLEEDTTGYVLRGSSDHEGHVLIQLHAPVDTETAEKIILPSSGALFSASSKVKDALVRRSDDYLLFSSIQPPPVRAWSRCLICARIFSSVGSVISLDAREQRCPLLKVPKTVLACGLLAATARCYSAQEQLERIGTQRQAEKPST